MRKKTLMIIGIFTIIFVLSSSVLAINNSKLTEENSLLISNDDESGESNLVSMVATAIFYLVAFVLVLFLAFFGTKLFAKYSRNIKKGSSINILEHFNLGNNNKILAIKIYNKTYILAINNNNTTVIDCIELNEENTKNEILYDKTSFKKQLESVLNADDNSSSNRNLNSKLLNMKMKVMQLKNRQEEEMGVKENGYEDKF